ncbi:MAG: antibiotic biosynthesis monooxygenase [Planctomycetota bacterium]
MSENVHHAVTRIPKVGCEAEFEAALGSFIEESLHSPGVCSALLIKPGLTGSREYGILRTFDNEATQEAFYNSPLFHDWEAKVEPLVEGPATERDVHGLAAFFPSADAPPPTWKMAVLTFLGVWPTAELWSRLLVPALGPPLGWLVGGVVNLLIIATLTWVVMPLLAKVFRGWLHPQSRE